MSLKTNYHTLAGHFAALPEYSIHCGTDYLAVKDVPKLISQNMPVKKILDLGCGTGLATRFLKKHFPQALVIGADINRNMLKQAALADPDGLYIHLSEGQDDACHPLLPATFDVITCSFMFGELQSHSEVGKLFHDIAMLLREGGFFIGWDVYKDLFKGKWLTVEGMFPPEQSIQDNDRYKVRLLPVNAELSGVYWSPEAIKENLLINNIKDIEISLPVIDEITDIDWMDEVRFAPYFVISGKKWITPNHSSL